MEETREGQTAADQFVGSAVVIGASIGPENTLLHLQTFTGDRVDYPLDALPDPAGEAYLRGQELRPISVKIRNGGLRCSVISLANDGPRTSTVTLGTALALYQSGVRAVVDGGLRLEAPCPTAPRPTGSTH